MHSTNSTDIRWNWVIDRIHNIVSNKNMFMEVILEYISSISICISISISINIIVLTSIRSMWRRTFMKYKKIDKKSFQYVKNNNFQCGHVAYNRDELYRICSLIPVFWIESRFQRHSFRFSHSRMETWNAVEVWNHNRSVVYTYTYNTQDVISSILFFFALKNYYPDIESFLKCWR